MTSKEIIDGVILSINARIGHRIEGCRHLRDLAQECNDLDMAGKMTAQMQILERLKKDLIQIEMNAKISYMGINTD